MTPEAWVTVVSLVANAMQAMWAAYLSARYHLVQETRTAVQKEAGESAPPPGE